MIGVGSNQVGGFAPALIGMAESLSAEIERLSPSGFARPNHPFGRAMTIGEIDATIEPGEIEIQGALGYLPDQFLWSMSNAHDDGWGGIW